LSKKRKKQSGAFFDGFESESTPTTKRKTKLTLLLDPAKVAQLLRATDLPIKEKVKERSLDYNTYTPEQASALVREYLDGKPKTESNF
jgi:hypothetical protein